MINTIQNVQEQIASGNFSVLFLIISFLGGVLSSLTPCTLGILPIITGYVAGYGEDKNLYKVFLQMVFFTLGLSVVLTVIGVFCAVTGHVFLAIGGKYWVLFIASLILLFGLNLLKVIEIPIPQFVKTMPKTNSASLFIYPFILGFMFALASTPCSTPILASIMSFATLTKNILYSSLLLFTFSLGQGIIIILAGVFTSFIKNVRGINKYGSIIMKFAGVILVLSSLLIFYGIFEPFFKN